MESDHYASLVWNSETHTASDAPLLNGLRIVQGRGEFDMAGREIPADFSAANHAICTGCPEKATEILLHLSDEDLALLEGTPLRTDLLFYLGKLYTDCGQLEQARECLLRILPIEPHPIVHYQLSAAYLPDLSCVSRALDHIQQAVALCPHNALLLDHLSHCLFEAGRPDEAARAGEEAMALAPDCAQLLRHVLWRLNYVPQTTRQSLLEGYQRWGRLVESSPVAPARPSSFGRPAAGPLRIGLLSCDFRRGSAGMLMDPFITAYDRQALAVYGYGDVACPDGTTERFKRCLNGYHSTFGLEAPAVAELIRGDGIDILIHIGGHCWGNRLDVVALKPAPIGVEFGGISSAGLAAQAYRVGDELIDPPGSLSTYLEKTIYLRGGGNPFLCRLS